MNAVPAVRSSNELLFNLAVGVTFALAGVWLVATRPVHWSWILFSFLMSLVPQSAMVVARRTMGPWRSTLWGFVVLGLIAAAFWLAGWPTGSNSALSFLFGFGAGTFLASALRTHIERRPAEPDPLIG